MNIKNNLSGLLDSTLFGDINNVSEDEIKRIAKLVWSCELGNAKPVGKLLGHEKALFIMVTILGDEYKKGYDSLPDDEEFRSFLLKKGTENEEVQSIIRRAKEVRRIESKKEVLLSMLAIMLIDRLDIQGGFIIYGDFEVAEVQEPEPCPGCGKYHDHKD
jgi:hypothetical protein